MSTVHRPRRLAVLLLAGALAASLGGCASGQTPASDEKVRLSYGIWDASAEPAMKQIAAAFTKEHPNVSVEVQVIPWEQYWTKLQTAATSGSAPDVFWMSPVNFQLYASNGVLAPFDNPDTEPYPAVLVDAATYDGKVYGLPKDVSTIGVYYNTELFDAAGLAYPSAGWTWDDYLKTAAVLTDASAGVWGSAAQLAPQTGYYNTIAQAGGYVISPDGKTTGYDQPAAATGIEFWTDQIASGVSPTSQQMTDTSPLDMFAAGKIAMLWGGSWAVSSFSQNEDIKDHFDIAPLPAGSAGNQSTVVSLTNVAFARSPHLSWAQKFATFASGEDAAKIQAATGALIPAYEGTQGAWVDSLPDYNLQVFVDAIDGAVPYPVSKNTSVWTTFESEILSQVWAGETSVSAGLTDLAGKMQRALDAENE